MRLLKFLRASHFNLVLRKKALWMQVIIQFISSKALSVCPQKQTQSAKLNVGMKQVFT